MTTAANSAIRNNALGPTSRIVVAINPAAAFGAQRGVGPHVVATLRARGHEVTSLSESSHGALVAVTDRAMADRPDALVVVGGDGMVNLGVNLVARRDIPLGIVPSGTGNDMARGLGIPIGDTDAAVDRLLAGLATSPRAIDAGLITRSDGTTSWFACVLSGGFDAAVNERANAMRRPKGRSRYTIALLRELVALKPIQYTLELDGVDEERAAILVAIGNNVSFGGGMRVAPDASLDDGLFDVVTLDPVNRRQLLRIFPLVFTGQHVHDARVTVRRASRVRLSARRVVAYADGERIGPLPLEIEVVPGALRVLA